MREKYLVSGEMRRAMSRKSMLLHCSRKAVEMSRLIVERRTNLRNLMYCFETMKASSVRTTCGKYKALNLGAGSHNNQGKLVDVNGNPRDVKVRIDVQEGP